MEDLKPFDIVSWYDIPPPAATATHTPPKR